MKDALTDNQIKSSMEDLSDFWEYQKGERSLYLKLKTQDFNDGLEKTVLVGKIADKLWHHPDIKLGFKYIEITITTHESNGLTDLDFHFAKEVDEAFSL